MCLPENTMALTPHDLVVEAKSQIKEISTADGQATMSRWILIDVREPDEFAAGHLPGAINIPRGVLEFKIAGFPACADPAKPYLIYCRTGGRSALAAVQLQKIGYLEVVSMAGGYVAWSEQGRPVDAPAPVSYD
jgi:rhodanese-related sulfurtransferase